MSVDLSKLQYISSANSFKNDSQLYTGTITLPTTVGAGASATVTQSVTITSSPVFSMFYAYYEEEYDMATRLEGLPGYNPAAWYISGSGNQPGVQVTAPTANAGTLGFALYPSINGNALTVTALIDNPYSNSITLAPLSIAWAFIEYTLTD